MKLAFIGLGVMGFPMAGHLQKAGHQVCVFNRTVEKAEAWARDFKGDWAKTPALAAKNADMVFVCVGNDNDVRSVVYGDNGVLSGMSENSILVDHTTTSAELAIELASKALEYKVGFLDAPVSGGQAGAENGALTIMVGGEKDIFNKAEPLMNVYGKKVALLGAAGAGQKCKMVNQICIAGIVQGLSEGIRFAQHAGLDIEQVKDVLKNGAAQSWQLENRALTMAENKFDFGFAIDWMRKDLGICFDEANKIGAELPVAKLVDEYYAQLQQKGENRSDTSVLIKRLK